MLPLAILKTYFGFRPQQGVQDFAKEVKALSESEKSELVALAAGELGVAVDVPQPKAA